MGEAAGKLKLHVSFGNLSAGQLTARLGLTVSREANWTAAQCEEYFVGSRLRIKIVRQDADGQEDMVGGLEPLESVVDVKGYSGRPKNFTAGLTFNTSEVNLQKLVAFSGSGGLMEFQRIGDAE